MLENSETSRFSQYQNRLTNFSNEFDLGLFLYITKKSLYWLLAILMMSALGAFLYLRYTPYTYEAKTILQLSEDDNAGKLLQVTSIAQENNDVESKQEQLRSKFLISRTIQQLPLRVSYYAKGEVLSSEQYVNSPYKVELIDIHNSIVQDQPVFIKFSDPNTFSINLGGKYYQNLRVNQEMDLPEFAFKVFVDKWEELKQYQDEYEIYFQINSLSVLTNRFSSVLGVRILNETAKTIEISLRDNNPAIARDFVKAHANEFLAYDLDKRRKSDNNVLSFLDEQLDTVFSRLRDSESRFNSYKQANKINDLQGESTVYLERMGNLENEIIQLDIESKLLRQVEKLASQNVSDVEVYNIIPLIAGSRYETSLAKPLDKLYELLSSKQQDLYSVTENSDRIKSLEFKIDVQKGLILQSIEALNEQLKQRQSELSKKIDLAENAYYNIPQKELEYARLQRLFNINEKYYTLLLEKSIEYRISKEGFVSNNQILEEARIPTTPVSPRKNLIWITFMIVGVILGLLIIALRYLFHNKVTSLNEVVRLSDASITTLGVVPAFKSKIPVSMLIVDKSPRSLIAESLRSVRTNLEFLGNSEGAKLITVTSTISGEGKTFIALNLGGVIAFSGKRVVICDLDLRKPKIHKGFQVSNDKGMSTLLIGKHTLSEVVHHSNLEHLDFITSGPIPPNPSELIISQRMDEISNLLREHYDVIIFDTPPVGLVSDGIGLLKKADYPIYIFRADYSQKLFVQVADKLINENHIKLAAILNGIDLDRSKYGTRYNYGYGYSYGYGYGSGYYDDKKHTNGNRIQRLLKRKK